MASGSIADRLRVAGFLWGRATKKARALAAAPIGLLSRWRFPSPERLLIAPQDIRTADPTIADDIYAGYFSFSAKVINTHGASPFDIASPSPEWAAALHGFGWLRHLRAADTPLARANARALVEEWIASRGRIESGPGWDIAAASRRLLSWLNQSPLILDGADRAFYRRFMKSLGWHARFLQRAMPVANDGRDRLLAAIALTELGLCSQGFDRLQRKSTRLLVQELTRQILPDGGHIGRSPQAIVDLLLDLLPLRQAYVARSLQVPPALVNSIDRMMPMLRLFRHSDGALALFNGMGVTAPDTVATVLAYDDARARPLTNAPHSGYQRIETGDSVVVIDTGKPPPLEFSARAHASCLAFEFSSAGSRILVNCGAPLLGRDALAAAARTTAAHNALVISDTNSSRIAGSVRGARGLDGLIVSGPSSIPVKRTESPAGTVLEASHDGYERRFGLIHTRVLTLSGDGGRLDGEDRLTRSGRKAAGAGEFAIRFHLHPQVTLARDGDEGAFVLIAPGGDAWVFRAEGQPVQVEESIFFASPDGIRATQQLVIASRASQMPEIRWSLTREPTETDPE